MKLLYCKTSFIICTTAFLLRQIDKHPATLNYKIISPVVVVVEASVYKTADCAVAAQQLS